MEWIRSSRCETNACVEVSFGTPGLVLVGRSDTPGTPRSKIVVFTVDEWDAFIRGVKDGEFDV